MKPEDLKKAQKTIQKAIWDGICLHESTHREGAIWTKCDHCEMRWADDEGGFPGGGPPTGAERAEEALEDIVSALVKAGGVE